MRNNSGVTLLEILMAMSLLMLILFAGGGIYISGMNLSLNAQYSTQAYRNAQLVMMHIEKNVRDAASSFTIGGNGGTLEFKTYNIDQPDFSHAPLVTRRYTFNTNSEQITFTSGGNSIAFNNIHDCRFEKFQNDGVVLRVTVEATDNRGSNTYKLSQCIEARFTASPSVFN